jgi:hypothetical protein
MLVVQDHHTTGAGMRAFKVVFIIGLLLALPRGAAMAQTTGDFQPFIGDFNGQVVFTGPVGFAKRDLEVSIRRERGGFSLKWTTISQKSSGALKRAEHFVAFAPAKRSGFYVSTGRIDRLGARIPIDPLAGDPQVWAKISGTTMTVYAVLITDDDKHEVQTYERTLVPGGMELKFNRVRDGKPLKTISAKLQSKNQGINLL